MPHASAGARLPLSRCPSLQITSLDEATELYSRLAAPVHIHGIPSKEPFSWRAHHLALGPLALVASATTSRVWAACEGTDDAYLLSLPLGDDSAETSVGREVTALVRGKSGLIVAPGRHSKVVIESGFQTLQMSLPRQSVLDAVTTLTGRTSEDVQFTQRLALDAPEVRAFSRMVGRVLREADAERPAFTAAGAAERWAEALIFRLLLVQPHALSELFATSPRAAEPRYVRRAAEFLDAHTDRHVTLAELVRVTGVSARALQLGFRRSRGCSPLEFARSRRLERARVMFLAEDATPTVSEVAQRVGIAHLGRFSVYYRQRFGESPTRTMARRPDAHPAP